MSVFGERMSKTWFSVFGDFYVVEYMIRGFVRYYDKKRNELQRIIQNVEEGI